MCTVSFIAVADKIIITSNRDELASRPAIAPKVYNISEKHMIFPKDPIAGGTWFATDEQANVAVLLNGAAARHKQDPPYRESRGMVLLAIAAARSPIRMWEDISLGGIAPFTIVLYEQGRLFQLRWDGMGKESKKLNPEENYIWSSVTIYPENIRKQRKHWFYRFLAATASITPEKVMRFHRHTHDKDSENGLVINRGDLLKTLSITQAVIQQNKVTMRHCDLLNDQEKLQSFIIV